MTITEDVNAHATVDKKGVHAQASGDVSGEAGGKKVGAHGDVSNESAPKGNVYKNF